MISLYSSTRTDIKLKQWIFPGAEVNGIGIDVFKRPKDRLW